MHRKVLVVDDHVDSVQLLSRVLDHYGCDMEVAYDGQDSIHLLKEQKFDLIILDWHMPQMNGRDTLLMLDKLMREHKLSSETKIPIIIYTGRTEEDLDLPECENIEYTGFINKQQNYAEQVRSFNFIFRSIH